MSLISNKERCKLKTLLGKCLVDGKPNSDKVDIFIEVCIRKGFDICDDRWIFSEQEHEAKKEARAVKWDSD